MKKKQPTGGFENIQEKFGRFRILIVGRANAGKTTILRAICNTTENPEVCDGKGNQIDLTQVEGSRGVGTIATCWTRTDMERIFTNAYQRGIHDI